MIVMKFGGTSVCDADRMLQAAELVRDQQQGKPVVLVSALAGVTDSLLRGGQLALEGNHSAVEVLVEELKDRHEQAGHGLAARSGKSWEAVRDELEPVLERVLEIYRGIALVGEMSPRVADFLAGQGEILSSRLMACACRARELSVVWIDPRDWLITNEDYQRAKPLWESVRERVHALFSPALKQDQIPVTGGYAGSTPEGTPTTLGRGGSDFSASILGVCLGAQEIQIWTDVDGMMTADPKLVPEARLLGEVSFTEAAELAYFGAKVLHPSTIKPAMEANIPVRILNTLKSEVPGTRITTTGCAEGTLRAIAIKKGITGITITAPRMLMAYGFLSSVFQVFEKYRTGVDLVATSEVSISLTIEDVQNLDTIRGELESFSQVEVHRHLAVICVVGRNFLHQQEVAGRIFGAMRQINILMISFGASDINLSFVVKEGDADRAVRLLHHELLESPIAAVS